MSTQLSRNPFTGEINIEVEKMSNDQVDQKIAIAQQAYISWKDTSLEHRSSLFHKLADIMDRDRDKICLLATKEMGMLQHISQGILTSCANLMRWYADNVEEVLGDKDFSHDGMTGKYVYDPLWVIYWIGPWNFPYNQVLRAAAANIIAWNTTVYKHSSNVPLCAAMIEKLFAEAWFPEWVYTNVYISGSQSEHIISNNAIQGVNITASEQAWSIVWWLAGKYLKPSVLELWWNDAFVLLDHKDTSAMVAKAVACRITMGGQRCNSSKRFIILDKHYEDFVEQMWLHMAALKIGDPMDPNSDLPPIATTKLLHEIHHQVEQTIAQWARLITWWKIVGSKEQFYAATVLADVTPEMTSYREEVFGPVASIVRSSSIEESIRLANNSDFGLSAVVYGDDIDQCKDVARQLEWWMIFINQQPASKSSLPFGWVKKTWYGKENWPDGLRSFTNKKVILY